MSDLVDIAQLGWCAGVIDGEGCIGVYHTAGTSYRLTVNVVNTDPRMLLALQRLLGGTVRGQEARGGEKRNTFTWYVRNQAARQVLEILLPFLVIKKEQALLGIEFHGIINDSRGRGVTVPEDILTKRCALVDRLKQLKKIEFPQDSISMDGSWPQTTLKSESI